MHCIDAMNVVFLHVAGIRQSDFAFNASAWRVQTLFKAMTPAYKGRLRHKQGRKKHTP